MSKIKKDFKNHMHNTLRIEKKELEELKREVFRTKAKEIVEEELPKSEEEQFKKIKEAEKRVAKSIKIGFYQKTSSNLIHIGETVRFKEKIEEVVKNGVLKKLEKAIQVKVTDKKE